METLIVVGVVLGVATTLGGWAYLRSQPLRAHLAPDGVQEVSVTVRERYRPATIVARRGVPLRLSFHRDEDDPCSQRVIFPDFGISRFLPAWKTTAIDLVPDRNGEFLFTCEMGMYQGTLVVTGGRLSWVRRLFGGQRAGTGAGPGAPAAD